MKIEQEVLHLNEKYVLEDGDTFMVIKKGEAVKVFLNGKEINYITELQYKQKPLEPTEIEVERYFMQEDFNKIKDIYREEKK